MRGACLCPPRVANMGFSIHTKSVFKAYFRFPSRESGSGLPSASGLPTRGMERGLRGHETLEAYSVRNHGAFRNHDHTDRGVNVSGEDIQWLLLDRTRLAKQDKKV